MTDPNPYYYSWTPLNESYTPGPWSVHPPSVGVDDNWHVVDTFDTFTAHVFSLNHTTDERARANAHLIAAAPEMLEALEVLTRFAKMACEAMGGGRRVQNRWRLSHLDAAHGWRSHKKGSRPMTPAARHDQLTIPCTPQADQWKADCEKAGWDQFRADRDAHPVNTSPLMAVFLPVFGAAVALLVFA